MRFQLAAAAAVSLAVVATNASLPPTFDTTSTAGTTTTTTMTTTAATTSTLTATPTATPTPTPTRYVMDCGGSLGSLCRGVCFCSEAEMNCHADPSARCYQMCKCLSAAAEDEPGEGKDAAAAASAALVDESWMQVAPGNRKILTHAMLDGSDRGLARDRGSRDYITIHYM
ncbi:hypothetical protein SAMD00023353_8400180 [Rosellinia necatrix]|uniref:Uncharacterized protein n=1 Tax=Rosellinia necatrix TaxID=77044 RepID=A0A1W2TW92_ROSNE|nr:hypothetical protein SAMD00023353_8400180 [Rosellinia necatrix]